MNPDTSSIMEITESDVDELLKRAIRTTLILGTVATLILWKATGWRDAAMLATGTGISTVSILEWRRLVGFIRARMDQKRSPRGTAITVLFFFVRLVVFAAAIYGSLKCFHGSITALFCGVGLAPFTIVLQAVRLLRE
jgi:hypothetical protein